MLSTCYILDSKYRKNICPRKCMLSQNVTPNFPYCGNKTLSLSLTFLETLQGPGRPDFVEIIILTLYCI